MKIKYNSNKLNKKGKIVRNTVLAGLLLVSFSLSGCNKTVLDTKYGFDKSLILGDDSAIILDVKQWKDYSGEQIQLTTNDNFVLLTSSFDTNCFYGNSNKYSIDNIAKEAISSKEVYYLTKDNNNDTIYNKDIIDTNWSFNKSITFNGNKALILPVGQWKDYSGEQLQVVTKDGLALVLSSYNSKLVCDDNSNITALDFAKSYVGVDGNVIDLSDSQQSDFNYDFFDTTYGFNKAVIIKDETSVIVPIDKWCDYEGEQLQLTIKNGPTIVTAAYDTILINDTTSKTKAYDIAFSLSNKVVDLADDYNDVSFYNKNIIDLNYGFSNAILSNDNSSSALKIDKWCDYEGEQLQIKLESGDVILSSSIMLDLINGGSSTINTSKLSKMYVSDNGKNIDKSNNNTNSDTYNKYVLDLQQKFKYALKVVDGNVTIIPLKSWKDFYNYDGTEHSESSPNCEQIQLILPDDTVIVTTMYDTLLVDNVTDISEIAELLRGNNGIITDLTEYVGSPNINNWNVSIFDTKYQFNYAIMNNGQTSQVFPIKNWLDFSEGEQLQINFSDNTGILTSFVNVTLVKPATKDIQEIIANAFSGNLEKDKNLVKIYE